MADLLIKCLICMCLFFAGNNAFSSTLSNIEIQSNGISGKIILDTDRNSVTKQKLSNDKIQIKLKKTVSENVKTDYLKAKDNIEISVIQNGKDSYINLSGKNVSRYEIVSAVDGSMISIDNGKKDAGIALLLFAAISAAAAMSKKPEKEQNKNDIPVEYTKTIRQQQVKIREYNTLRNRKNLNQNIIHGNLVADFANSTKNAAVTVPIGFKNSNVKYFEYQKELKKAANS